MADLTVLLEHVEKPHNLSAILRSCDAVGALEAHIVSLQGRPRTFNSTAQGSQKWVPLNDHPTIFQVMTAHQARHHPAAYFRPARSGVNMFKRGALSV